MTNGFVTLQRKFFDHWLWEEKREFSKAEAWIDLIRSAAFNSHTRMIRGVLITVGKGEIIASLRYLGDRWGWKKDKVSAFVRLLESQTMIRRETRQLETIIILCNYDSYNDPSEDESDSESDDFQTRTRQSPDSHPTKKKKGNKVNKVQEEKEESAGAVISKIEILLPYPSKEFAEAWQSWIDHKKEIKQKLPPSTMAAQLKKLSKWGEVKAIEAIENSISGKWQGLFEPKDQQPSLFPINGKGTAESRQSPAIKKETIEIPNLRMRS